MKKYLLLILFVGCSPNGHEVRKGPNFLKETCINGVVYYENGSFGPTSSNYAITPKFLPNGRIEACK